MKYYEYLASQLYIVATSTEELQHRMAPGVFLYSDTPSLKKAINEVRQLATPNLDGLNFSLSQNWQSKAEDVVMFLESL
jgi:hypothetical protein